MKPIFGFTAAKRAQLALPRVKTLLLRTWDKVMYELEGRDTIASAASIVGLPAIRIKTIGVKGE
jgi:hypothetical protein